MPLKNETKQFLSYLHNNPKIRQDIRAPSGKTLLYAGSFFKPVWKEIADQKKNNPAFADKYTLPDILGQITTHGVPHNNLLEYTQATEKAVPWKDDGFIIWRALSGIFASNASGPVSFYVGSGVKSMNSSAQIEERKVFAVTEIGVLLRNDKVDPMTKDILSYFQRCVSSGNTDMNFAYTAS
ncbi:MULTISPECIES: hypothetical protein [unclassified Methylobacterium]|uniref:hypothetical protein n=1 Tax=unclassified Methylobacterium TaxID=2615210 RepID=UPI00226A158E|nr:MULTISPECIES: hypothetical protein [unclassified Methylobacterium]